MLVDWGSGINSMCIYMYIHNYMYICITHIGYNNRNGTCRYSKEMFVDNLIFMNGILILSRIFTILMTECVNFHY